MHIAITRFGNTMLRFLEVHNFKKGNFFVVFYRVLMFIPANIIVFLFAILIMCLDGIIEAFKYGLNEVIKSTRGEVSTESQQSKNFYLDLGIIPVKYIVSITILPILVIKLVLEGSCNLMMVIFSLSMELVYQ